MIKNNYFFRTFLILVLILLCGNVSFPEVLKADRDEFNLLLESSDIENIDSSIINLKSFIEKHPELTFSGVRQLVSMFIYGGKSEEGLLYFGKLPANKLFQKVVGFWHFQNMGFTLSEENLNSLVKEIESDSKSWNKINMRNQILIGFLLENNRTFDESIEKLPLDEEVKLLNEVKQKIDNLNLKGIHELLISFPKNSDFLYLVSECFPNINGETKIQHSEMIYLAEESAKVGNLESKLYLQTQCMIIEVSYLEESILDKKKYDTVLSETKKYIFIDMAIEMVSTLTFRSIFNSDYEKALILATEAEFLSRKYHLKMNQGINLGYMGLCYNNLSQFDKAINCYEESCKVLKILDPGWYRVWREKLAYSYASIGDTEAAEKIHLQVFKEELKNADGIQLQYAYRNLAELYLKKGELKKAQHYLNFVKSKSFPGLSKKNNAIWGRLEYAKGNYKKAVKYYKKCLSDKAPMDVTTQIGAMSQLASAYQALNENDNALKAYENTSEFLEYLARTRFSNLAYRKGFFSQHHSLYLNYVSFLVNVAKKPGEAWLLVEHLETGPFQYFSDIIKKHLQSLLPNQEANLPSYSFDKAEKNFALKSLVVRVVDAKTNEKRTIIAGPGGVFQTDGTFYTQISKDTDIFQIALSKNHWAGITDKYVVMDGEKLELPESPDRVLKSIAFSKGNLLVGSSIGLYQYSNKQWELIYNEKILNLCTVTEGEIVGVAGKGILFLQFLKDNKYDGARNLYPKNIELKSLVSFSKISDNQFIVFTTDAILFLNKSKITSRIPFSYGVINKVTSFGTGRWLISTVLNKLFVLENGQLHKVKTDNSKIVSGCRAGKTSFLSTDQIILVETDNSLKKTPLFKSTGFEYPNSMEKISSRKIAIGFRGQGITVHNVKDGSFLGFFKSQVEKFSVSEAKLAILTGSGHVKVYSGNLPKKMKLEKTFYPSSPIQSMLQQSDGSLFASFIGGGLALWKSDEAPHFFGRKQGLPSGESIYALKNFNGMLKLGTSDSIIDFDLKNTCGITPIPGKVVCFSEIEKKLVVGTENGAFIMENSILHPLFENFTTGKILNMDFSGDTLAATTDNGVYLKTLSGTFHIPTPERCNFVAVDNKQLLMVTNKNILNFMSSEIPVIVHLGFKYFVIATKNKIKFALRDAASSLLLDIGESKMVAVSMVDTDCIEMETEELSNIKVSLISKFGGKSSYLGIPGIYENGQKVSEDLLKPGIHNFVIRGVHPFLKEGIGFKINLTRKISGGWLLSIILLIVVITLLVIKYFKWKKGRYIAHYKLIRQLGEGGMGTVHLAKDVRNNRTVALKLLHHQVGEVMVERFKREWQILDNIQHPNIVSVYDRGEHMEQFFIAMEHIQGSTMAEILEKNGHLPEKFVIDCSISVTNALEIIHNQFIVHRDIKPSNIMYARNYEKTTGKIKPGEIKLMDFGVSKELLKEGLTTAGSLVGTLRYVAPESISDLAVDLRSDIYALGVTMYHLLTGKPPFDDENQVSIYYKILNSPPPPFPKDLNISSEMEAVVIRCLEKEPEKRFQNANELRLFLSSLGPYLDSSQQGKNGDIIPKK